MTKRAWGLVLVLIVILGAWWAIRTYGPLLFRNMGEFGVQRVHPAPQSLANSQLHSKPARLVTLQQALASMPRPHLQPDRRFLEAAALIQDFPSEPSGAAASATFQNGAWTISLSNQILGQVPLYPGFIDAMTLLQKEAQERFAALHASCTVLDPGLAAQTEVFDEKTLETALYKLNADYTPPAPNPTDTYLAARAVARLAYLEDDETGTADSLYAKALTLVAVAETMCDKRMPEAESLLAAGMGYTGAAARALQQANVRDAWDFYFTRDDSDLEQMARLNPDSKSASYFWLRRMADQGQAQPWSAWLKQRYGNNPPVPVADTMLRLPGHGPIQSYAQYIPLMVLGALPGSENITVAPFSPVADPAQAIKLFVEGQAYIARVVTGPYLTASDLAAYYRGFFYTGLYEEGYFLTAILDSSAGAENYDQLLAGAAGATADEFHRWYDASVHDMQSPLALPQVVRDMSDSKQFSPGLYYDLWSDSVGQLGNSKLDARRSIGNLAVAFDSRPSLRWDYAQALHWSFDFPDYESAISSLAALDDANSPTYSLVFYAYKGDWQKLFKLAEDPKLPSATRLAALTNIGDNIQAPQVDAAWQSFIENHPAYSDAYRGYIQYLQKGADSQRLARVARIWLASLSSDANDFDYFRASVALAKAQARQGQLAAAWVTISGVTFVGGNPPVAGTSPKITNFYAPVLTEAASIALQRRDFSMADYLSEVEAARYANSLENQMPLLRILWAQGQYTKAAGYLAKWPYSIADYEWYNVIGKEYGTDFKSDPEVAGIAFQAELDAVPRPSASALHAIAAGAGDVSPTVGYTLESALGRPSLNPQNFQNTLVEYGFLNQIKGNSAALAWLQANLPHPVTAEQQDMAVFMYYDTGNYELLWDLIPDPAATGHPDETWLLRAAASVQGTKLSTEQQRILQAHFAAADNSWYDQLGKYLILGTGESIILQKPLDPHALSEASYYMALRALSVKDYPQAEYWLKVDFETDQHSNGEYRWADDLLAYWYKTGESPEVLAAKHVLYDVSVKP